MPALYFAHRHSWILLVQCHHIASCDCSTRRRSCGVSIPHAYAAHLKHSVVLRLQKTYTFRKIWAQVREQTRWIEEIYLWEAVKPRRFLWEEMSQNTEQFTASTSFNTFQTSFLTLEITNPTTMQVERASRRQPHSADALYGPGRYEKICWEWSLRS